MNEDQFLKLFKYIEAFRAEVNAKLDQKADKDRVYSALDYIIKQLEIHDQERLFTNHQLDRHEAWIKQLAANTNTKLAPEP